MGFDFGRISGMLSSYMDTDFVDIYRQLPTSPTRVMVYENISCHISTQTADNPDPVAIDVVPVITSLRIDAATWVDFQNNDYIVAKKCDASHEILKVYRGVCGHPAMDQCRQFITMQMNASAVPDEPVNPPPPQNPSIIRILFVDETNHQIDMEATRQVETGQSITIEPERIGNYQHVSTKLDGLLLSTTEATIMEAKSEGHEIVFGYESIRDLEYFRVFADGMFTQTNGAISFGKHLLMKIYFEVIQEYSDKSLDISVASSFIMHPEMGRIDLKSGQWIKLFPTGEWFEITEQRPSVYDGVVLKIVPIYVNDEAEGIQITEWYD